MMWLAAMAAGMAVLALVLALVCESKAGALRLARLDVTCLSAEVMQAGEARQAKDEALEVSLRASAELKRRREIDDGLIVQHLQRAAEAERKLVDLDEERNGEIADLTAKNQHLAEECVFWRAKASDWEQKFLAANADGIKARETVADWVSQRTFGTKIFSHSPALPERANLPQPVMKHRIQGRDAVHLAEAQFNKDYQDYVNSWAQPPANGTAKG